MTNDSMLCLMVHHKLCSAWVIPCQLTQCLKRYPLRFCSKFIHLVYVTRIDDPYNLRSFGRVFSEILTLKKCQIGVFWAQLPPYSKNACNSNLQVRYGSQKKHILKGNLPRIPNSPSKKLKFFLGTWPCDLFLDLEFPKSVSPKNVLTFLF